MKVFVCYNLQPMNRAEKFRQAIAAFREGKNVIKTLRGAGGADEDMIEFAYDLQAGSYVEALNDKRILDIQQRTGQRLTEILQNLGARSVCEAGTGEGITLGFITAPAVRFSAFDISLSRLLVAQSFLRERIHGVRLFSANLSEIPLPDNSVDVMLTVHAVEPNGGNEATILRELHRVAARYLMMIEPDYERGSDAQQSRMREHGYVRGLRDHLHELSGKLVSDEPWPIVTNELNRASLFLFEKNQDSSEFRFVSPQLKSELQPWSGFYFSPAEGCLYPIVNNLPVLRSSAALICSRAQDF